MSNRSREFDRGRLVIVVAALFVAILAAFSVAGALVTSDEALSALTGLSATLAGFILAVKTLLGDASSLLPGNWVLAVVQAKEMRHRFTRLSLLFYLHVMVSFSSIFCIALNDNVTEWPRFAPHLFTFLVGFTAVMTLELPRSLKAIQDERLEAVIERRRSAGER